MAFSMNGDEIFDFKDEPEERPVHDIDWYCTNADCGNMWSLPPGEHPGPCSGCGGEMEAETP